MTWTIFPFPFLLSSRSSQPHFVDREIGEKRSGNWEFIITIYFIIVLRWYLVNPDAPLGNILRNVTLQKWKEIIQMLRKYSFLRINPRRRISFERLQSGEIKIPAVKISRPRVVELCFRHASTVSRVLVSSYSIHVSTPRDDGSCHVPANWPRRAQEPRIRIPPSGTATPEISTAKKSTTITVTYPDLFENRDRDGNPTFVGNERWLPRLERKMFLDPLIVIEKKIVYYRSFNFVQRPKDSFKRYSIINRGVRFSFLRSKLAEDSNSR